jgi:hypothetical protein
MARILGVRSSFSLVFVGLALAFAGCGGSSASSPPQASLLGSAVDGVAQAANAATRYARDDSRALEKRQYAVPAGIRRF